MDSAQQVVDAVVVGGGHHGLVAATVLADAGWDVLALEANERVGGAVASDELAGAVMDSFSSCHPLGVASPVLRSLELEEHGLEWCHAARALVHVAGADDLTGSTICPDPEQTADGLDDPHDAAQWRRLCEHFQQVREPLLTALLTQWPPTTSALGLVRAVGARELLDFARFALLPLDRMVHELFRGHRARDIFAGNAMHADIPPQAPGSGMFGWLMSMLAQDVGFPSPRGGAVKLAEALRSRAEQAGAAVHTGQPVDNVVVHHGRAVGVTTASGATIRARRAVIANTSAPALYHRLLPEASVPPGLAARLERFAWDLPTVKLNYHLAAPLPWLASAARGSGVVHAGLGASGLARWSTALETGVVPDQVFALVGQMATIDPSRAPDGNEALWLYTHTPRHQTGPGPVAQVVANTELMLDRLAPGWRDLVIDRWTQTPDDLAAADDNLAMGAVAGGTMQLFQQAYWRPVTGLGGPGTHVEALYLASAGAHPGGGVHGGAGYLAARAALRDQSWWGRPLRRARLGALHRLYERPPAIG